MDLAIVLSRLRRRWWVVTAAALLALGGAGLALAGRSDRYERTIHFVLRPDASVSVRDLPNALEALKSDGPLVQSVTGALSSKEMLRRAETATHVPPAPGYTITSDARPGSTLIDSTVAGPQAPVVDRLGDGFALVASDYVAGSYAAYTLDRLGSDPGGEGTGLQPTQLVVLALLLGGALGVGAVLAELRLESSLRPAAAHRAATTRARRRTPGPKPHERPTEELEFAAQTARDPVPRVRARSNQPPTPVWVPDDERCRATTSKGALCRNRRVDDRGYCRRHLSLLMGDGADLPRENGARLIRLSGPAWRASEGTAPPSGQSDRSGSEEDED
jgi:hypothetical protein